MMNKFIFKVITLLSLCVTSSFSWTLVYENDNNGNKISGDLNTLIKAAQNAYDIKFSFNDGQTIVIASTVIISNGLVTGISNPVMGVNIENGIIKFWSNDIYYNYYIVDTKGNVQTKYLYPVSGNMGGENDLKKSVKWFVKY